jgi:hypothetical protein
MVNRLRLATVAVAAIAAGLLTAPLAAASPVFPLAPACDGYKLPSFMGITESWKNRDGGDVTVTIGWSPDGKSGRANMGGYGGNDPSFGNVSGGLQGRHAEFRIDWDQGTYQGSYSRFAGDVRDDLSLDGVVENHFLPGTQSWRMEGQVECVAAKPDNSPAPGQKTATVLQAVDVYNQPDGKGTVYRDADGHNIFLAAGRQVPLVKPCRDNWCQVVDPDVPGEAWVYQTPFLQVP